MAFREKTAWLTLLCVAVAYTVSLGWAGSVERSAEPPSSVVIWYFGLVTGVQMVILSNRRGWHG